MRRILPAKDRRRPSDAVDPESTSVGSIVRIGSQRAMGYGTVARNRTLLDIQCAATQRQVIANGNRAITCLGQRMTCERPARQAAW